MKFTPSPEFDHDSDLTPQDLSRYVCYDDSGGKYWVLTPLRWTCFSRKGAVDQLMYTYSCTKVQASEAMRKCEQYPVSHACAVGGYPMGIIEDGDNRILVTTSPQYIEPQAGDCESITDRLLAIFGPAQLEIFFTWLKLSIEMFRSLTWMPGPILVLAGPSNCGKSWLLSFMRKLFGDRPPGLPFEFFSRNSSFNSDVTGSELLVVENESYSDRSSDRRAFGAKLRGCATNMYRRMEQKYSNPLSMFSLNRCVITISDDPESLSTLPIMDQDLRDKILVMKLNKPKWDRMIANPQDRADYEREWIEELPAFVDYLDRWQIPSDLVADRTGLISFQDSALRSDINAGSPLQTIMDLIDEAIERNSKGRVMWKGKASELARQLLGHDDPLIASQAQKDIQNGTHLGRQLAALAHQKPGRVSGAMGHGSSKNWTIYNPDEEDDMKSPGRRLLEKMAAGKVVDIKAHQK